MAFRFGTAAIMGHQAACYFQACLHSVADSSAWHAQVCLRHADEDLELFSIAAHVPPVMLAQRPAPEGTALVWDERMQLHAEGQVRPHPERPDRIRAVMARLLNSNVAGELMFSFGA